MVGYVEAHPGDARTLTQRTKEIPMTIPVALDTCRKSHHVEYLLRVYENHGNGVFWQARKVSRSGYPQDVKIRISGDVFEARPRQGTSSFPGPFPYGGGVGKRAWERGWAR